MAYNFPDSPTVGQVFEKWTWNGEAWVLTPPANYTQVEADARFVNVAGDTMTGHLDLPTGPGNSQAVRKDYVDTSKVAKAGDTMTGHLALPTGPAAANAVRKDYVDAAIAAIPAPDMSSKVSKAGDSMTGMLTTNTDTQNIASGGGHNTIQVFASGGQAAITFHNSGAFATNFGMDNGGNFYFGGWSHGAVAYRLWSTRDFNYTPQANLGFTPVQQNGGAGHVGSKVYIGWDGGGTKIQIDASDQGRIAMVSYLGAYLSNGRLPHAGDTTLTNAGAFYDSIANSVHTGYHKDFNTNMLIGHRCRHVQGYTTGWFTFAFA